MMDAWMRIAQTMIRNLVGNPDNQNDFYILLGVAVVAFFIGMWLLEMAFGLTAASPFRRLVGVVLVALTGLVGATASTIYLTPMAADPLVQLILVIAGAVILILAVALPLYKLLLRTSYVKALTCVVGGFFMAAICIPLVISAMGAIKAGAANARRGAERSDTVEKAVEGKL